MVLTVTLVIFFFVIMLIIIPYSVEVKINIRYDESKKQMIKTSKDNNYIVFKLFKVIPIYRLNMNNPNNKIKKIKKYVAQETVFKRVFFTLFKKYRFRKFVMMLGFNLGDVIINSYVNAFLNSIICMYINYKQENFDLKRLYYQIQITENPLNLNLHCIFNAKIVDTIKEIIKEHKKNKKGKEKSEIFERRSDLYDRTSN